MVLVRAFLGAAGILEYANHVADRHDLRRDIRFNWRVKSAAYAEDSATWLLTAEDGRQVRGRFCVMATGCLSVPNWPDIDGIDDFSGPTFHTALWPHEKVEFTGKRVAVIGTGSSAVQSLPHIAGEAEQVTVFQRTANYSIPAHNGPLDKDREAMFKADYPGFRARAKQTVTAFTPNTVKRRWPAPIPTPSGRCWRNAGKRAA